MCVCVCVCVKSVCVCQECVCVSRVCFRFSPFSLCLSPGLPLCLRSAWSGLVWSGVVWSGVLCSALLCSALLCSDYRLVFFSGSSVGNHGRVTLSLLKAAFSSFSLAHFACFFCRIDLFFYFSSGGKPFALSSPFLAVEKRSGRSRPPCEVPSSSSSSSSSSCAGDEHPHGCRQP